MSIINEKSTSGDEMFDLIVVGAGSGGVRAARRAAALGARVAIIEKSALGGTCVNLGCVPKKWMVYASEFAGVFDSSDGYGWVWPDKRRPVFDWHTLRENSAQGIQRLNQVYARLLKESGVVLIRGSAQLMDAHTLCVEQAKETSPIKTVYCAQSILIATGGSPVMPDFPGNEWAITSDQVFSLPQLPARLLVVGGGYIATEFAGIFNGLGVQTTLAYRGALFLRGFDQDVRHFVAEQMAARDIHLRFNTTIRSITPLPEQTGAGMPELLVMYSDGSTQIVDHVLCATGRRPNVAGLNLGALGLQLNDRGAIAVDDFFQTQVPSIYALGDVIDRVALTPVAISEAVCLTQNLFGAMSGSHTRQVNTPDPDRWKALDYDNIPTAVFCQPPIATVGLTEDAAREQCDVLIFRTQFKPMKHSFTGLDEKVLMKIVVDAGSDRVLGVHMVGESAAEIIQAIAIAVKAGLTKAQFDQTMAIHPTLAEELVTLREPVSE